MAIVSLSENVPKGILAKKNCSENRSGFDPTPLSNVQCDATVYHGTTNFSEQETELKSDLENSARFFCSSSGLSECEKKTTDRHECIFFYDPCSCAADFFRQKSHLFGVAKWGKFRHNSF